MEATAADEGGGEVIGEEDQAVLQFLDSLDSYLSLMSSLSSTLRQGWLELASARHSMGSSRISSAFFDLKPHSSATTVLMNGSIGEDLNFSLSKWRCQNDEKCSAKEADGKTDKQAASHLRQEDSSGGQGTHSVADYSTSVDNQVQKERSKSLSMFGTFVSPKLRVAQVSFETALELIIEMANKRSAILSTFSQLQKVDSSN